MTLLRLGIIGSHTGTTMQAIVDACVEGSLPAQIGVVVSNNSNSGVAQRSLRHGLPFRHISAKTHGSEEGADVALADALQLHQVELVILAGYMKKLGAVTLARFAGRIINTHPALLPSYGGQGMYGDRVHAAVLAAGESVTGVSIHLVDGEYDTGAVLAQRTVGILPGDTVETLSERLKEVERPLLVETIVKIARGEIPLAPVRSCS